MTMKFESINVESIQNKQTSCQKKSEVRILTNKIVNNENNKNRIANKEKPTK